TSTSPSTSTSSAAFSQLRPSRPPIHAGPVIHGVSTSATSSRDVRSSSFRSGSTSSSGALPKLTRQFSHVLIPGCPKYIRNSTLSAPLSPALSLAAVQYGGPQTRISSRTIFQGQVRFQLSRTADGVTTVYPEDVPLNRLFEFVTPGYLQAFEHEQYAAEEEQEKLKKREKRRGRPPGSRKKPTTGLSTQAGSGASNSRLSSSKHSSPSATSGIGPLQTDLNIGAIEKSRPSSSAQSSSSRGPSSRSTRSQQSEEADQGRYRMLNPMPQRILQPVTRSPTTSPVPIETGRLLSPARIRSLPKFSVTVQLQQHVDLYSTNGGPRHPAAIGSSPFTSLEHAKNKTSNRHVSRPPSTLRHVDLYSTNGGPRHPAAIGSSPFTSLEPAKNKTSNRHVSRPPSTLRLATVTPSSHSSTVDVGDSDDEQSGDSDAMLRRSQGQRVQNLKQRATSTVHDGFHTGPGAKQPYRPSSAKAMALASSSSPVPPSSSSKKRASSSKPTAYHPRTTKKRKRLFTRKAFTPKPTQEEDDWYIERIIDHRKTSQRSPYNFEYLIKWKDHPREENTWQTEDSLVGADEVLKKYLASIAVERAGAHPKRWELAVEGNDGREGADVEMDM
ncbi:hypothetical protein MMC08_007176, partial [Hypocenomyce scalaris]|nr:hypothetical protein [Hypocenomyce scalaris]